MIDSIRAKRIYSDMNRIRSFEERTVRLFEEDKLRGSVHLYIGEEAIAATICSHLTDDDYITGTHRGHGHCLAKGARMDKAMAELMGRSTGYCKGRGGSMHIADFAGGNLGANAIVGGGIPIAVGAALSIKLQKQDRVSVACFGDGASNAGIFHESINLAAVWKLPIIFVCENNRFGISVPVEQSTSVEDISVRAKSYGIPGKTVDGNDVEAIDEAFREALQRARNGEGPTLLECRTYRWLGHWVGDPQNYRSRDETERWKLKCPIKRYREVLLQQGFSPEELDEIEENARREAEDATQFALNSPEPDATRVLDDVFYTGEEV